MSSEGRYDDLTNRKTGSNDLDMYDAARWPIMNDDD